MNTTSNISALQGSGVANPPQSQSHGQTPQGLLGFLDIILQQINAAQQGGAVLPSAQDSQAGLDGLAEKIAALLKKNGISENTLQSMSPQDLTAKITALLQQQNITLPASLQNLSPADLAAKIAAQIQQDNAIAAKGPPIKPTLTSDLIAPQSLSVQDVQTKDDIAKKISALLENQQKNASAAIDPAQLQQLKDQLAALQTASGTINPDTLKQLTTDMGNFLASQGVSRSAITNFIADLSQQSQKDQSSISDASSTQTTNPPLAPVATVTPPVAPPLQSDTTPATISQANAPAPGLSVVDMPINLSSKGIVTQGTKATVIGGGKDDTAANNLPQQLSSDIAGQQQQGSLPQQNLTSKIAGPSVNPALINDLANNGGNSAGSGNGFGSQGSDAQQQSLTGNAALLQPMNADILVNQNFTNYLAAARSDASQTTQLINVQLQNNINAGINSMTLQLEPADLGKLNVKLSFTRDGTVKAHMTVDKPETLALLQKDSSHLQRALQQSGLNADENSISFDLGQQGRQQNLNGYNSGGGANGFASRTDEIDTSNALQAQIALQASGYITSSGVNIMV